MERLGTEPTEESGREFRELREDTSKVSAVQDHNVHARKPFQAARIQRAQEIGRSTLQVAWERVFKKYVWLFADLGLIVRKLARSGVHVARVKVASEDASRGHNRR